MPIGVIFSMTRNPDRFAEARVRALLLKEQGLHHRFNKHRIGILLSSSAFTKEPCAVQILLQRQYMDAADEVRGFAQKEVRFVQEAQLKRIFKEKHDVVLSVLANEKSGYILTLQTTDIVTRLGL